MVNVVMLSVMVPLRCLSSRSGALTLNIATLVLKAFCFKFNNAQKLEVKV
jgi:hypothetical protein